MSNFYSEELKGPHRVLELGDLEVEHGGTIAGARLLYKTHGELNAARDNAVLLPHMYASTPSSVESLVGPGRALDASRWFVICPGMLGGGFSSSPSNTPGFPDVTIGDDVSVQHRLVTQELGLERLALVTGFSMGAQQAYEWAVRFPAVVERCAPIGGTARTTVHNQLIVHLAERALDTSLELHGHVWSTVGLSPELWRSEGWREAGFTSADDVVARLFVGDFTAQDAGNLRALCRKWRCADVGRLAAGDLTAALGAITARTTVIGLSHDTLFPPSDLAAEAALVPGAQVRTIDTPWGHWGFEMTEGAREQLDATLGTLLAS